MLSSEWLTGLALAAPSIRRPSPCEALDENELRSYVLDAQSAIDRGEADLPAAILEEVRRRLPCLTFAPQPRMWADLLVSEAIVEFSRGGNWEDPLAAALRLRPGIDRGVGPGHPIALFEPPALDGMGPPVPPGVTLYVDGRPSPVLPPDEGLWLVQRTDGRFWTSVVVVDRGLPDGFLEAPIEGPPRVASWFRAGVLAGGATGVASPDWEGAGRFPAVRTHDSALGLGADLHATFYSPFGVLASGWLAASPTSTGVNGRVSAILRRGALTAGVGVGVSAVETWTADAAPVSTDGVAVAASGGSDPGGGGLSPSSVTASGAVRFDPRAWSGASTSPDLSSRTDLLRLVAGTLLVHRRGDPFDASLVVGAGPAIRVVSVEGGFTARVFGEQRLRLGLVFDVRDATYQLPPAPGNLVGVNAGRALLRIDAVFGEY